VLPADVPAAPLHADVEHAVPTPGLRRDHVAGRDACLEIDVERDDGASRGGHGRNLIFASRSRSLGLIARAYWCAASIISCLSG
jgi:hypothetical protein